ncbi:MAG: carboxypeptidase regulatory-like domain-containing protein, partial [Knoellia sp.]
MRQVAVLLVTAVLGFTLALASAAPAQAASGYTITGVVTGLDATGTSVPLADAYFYAEPVDWNDNRNIYGHADAAGRFTIDVGEPGDYTLYANCSSGTACAETYAPQYYDQANGHGDAKTIVVSTTTPVTANMRLPRWATVKGKVTSDAGAPIVGITVETAPTSGGTMVSTTTDATGAYTLAKVVPGSVAISAREERGQHNWTAEHWNGTSESTPTWPNPSPVLPAGPTVTTANFQLAQASGFYGEAVDSAGAPIQGVGWTTYTYNTSTGDWDTPQYGPRMTDENGKFFWNTAVGGRYKVCFDDTYYGPAAPVRDLRYGSRCWDNAADSATATVLTQPATPLQRTLRVVLPTLGKSLTASDPWIDGVAKVGSPLKVYPGAWGPTGVQLAYQWGWYDEANGFAFMPVTGATATTYTPTADLAGKYVAVRVTGTLAGYATAQMLAGGHGKVGESGVALTSPLTITGTPAVGQVLTATHGTPANGDAIDYDSYEWRVGGESAGWDKTLTLTSDMVGKTVNVRYYVRTTSSNSDITYVATAGPVTAPLGTLTAPTPTITGTAKAGSTLTAVPGTWGPAPVTLAYQWKRAGVAISGATASTHVLTGSDTGKAITVTVTGTKSGYTTAAKTSAATPAVAAGTLTAPVPTISGSKTVGQTLTAVPGTWGPAPVTLAYQWYRSGVAITGATASTYVLTATDQTNTMTVRVTGTKTGYTSVAKTSVATTAVLGALTSPTPTISGSRTVGSTLT